MSVSEDEVMEALRAAIAVVLEHDGAAVTRSTLLVEDLGADSLAIVEIVEVLEAELSARVAHPVRLDDEVLDDLRTAGDAVDQVLAQL